VNDRGETVEQALPAEPVELLGLSGTPEAGDEFVVVDSEARAREVTEYRARKRRETRQAAHSRQSLDQLLKSQKEGEKRLLLSSSRRTCKARSKRSMALWSSSDPMKSACRCCSAASVASRIRCYPCPGLWRGDHRLQRARQYTGRERASSRRRRDPLLHIIYNVIDDVKAACPACSRPRPRAVPRHAEILEVFNISKVGKVRGLPVTEGVVRRGAKVRLIAMTSFIHEGDLVTLKRFKDEVREVQTGQECGMAFANYQEYPEGRRDRVLRGRDRQADALGVERDGLSFGRLNAIRIMSRQQTHSSQKGPSNVNCGWERCCAIRSPKSCVNANPRSRSRRRLGYGDSSKAFAPICVMRRCSSNLWAEGRRKSSLPRSTGIAATCAARWGEPSR